MASETRLQEVMHDVCLIHFKQRYEMKKHSDAKGQYFERKCIIGLLSVTGSGKVFSVPEILELPCRIELFKTKGLTFTSVYNSYSAK